MSVQENVHAWCDTCQVIAVGKRNTGKTEYVEWLRDKQGWAVVYAANLPGGYRTRCPDCKHTKVAN